MTSNEQNEWATKAATEVMDRMEKEVENDATQWNGLFVWEAGDADTVHQILKEKFIESLTIQETSLRKEWAGKVRKMKTSVWKKVCIENIDTLRRVDDRDALLDEILALIEPDSTGGDKS